MSYYTKITTAGLAAITAAMNNSSKVPITYMAFGDGNGYIPEPDENATSLVNEVYRVGVNKVEVHSKNPNWLVCEAIIPSAVGGFNIREVALYDSTGNTMLAIASYPPTYKPTVEEGAAKIQTIRIVIQVDNSGNFELIVDPDVVLATRKEVDDIKNIVTLNSLNISDLRTIKGNKNKQRITTSEYFEGTGKGGADYYWDSGSNLDDNGFSVIQVNNVPTGRWILDLKNREISAMCAGVLLDESASSSLQLQKVIDLMSITGGGKVTLPAITLAANIKLKSNVTLEGSVLAGTLFTPATKIISSDSSQVIQVTEPGARLKLIELDGRNNLGVQRASFGLAISAGNFKAWGIKSSYARFDALYISNGAEDIEIEHAILEYVSRNVMSIVGGSKIRIKNSTITEDADIVAGLYLLDIEPVAPSYAYDVVFENVKLNKVKQTSNSSVILKHTVSPNGYADITFKYCSFLGYSNIRINSDNFKGLYLYYNIFEGAAFGGVSTNLFKVSQGEAIGNMFNQVSDRVNFFSYQTSFGGDFIFKHNNFNIAPSTNPANNASWGENVFANGLTPIEPVDRTLLGENKRKNIELQSELANAFFTSQIRKVSLTTEYKDILTIKNRSTTHITIAATDATEAVGSKAFVELIASSDLTNVEVISTDKINHALYGIDFLWEGKTLKLKCRSSTAESFVIKVDVYADHSSYKKVIWLI
ncbi:phage tail protein [Acinetobacter baumannii]